jgi:peroxiredoxin/predicted 2-oxoglutarate/Fe(II)-dependent dioxygenase YbiX
MPTRNVTLLPGDVAPWFVARCTSNEAYHFNSVAGRYVVLCLFGSSVQAAANGVLAAFLARRDVFDDTRACFFGVSVDPEDERQARVREILPGYRWFWDFDKAVSRLYGAVKDKDPDTYLPQTMLLDEYLRVIAVLPFGDDAAAHVERILGLIAARPQIPTGPAELPNAPVLAVPRVFEPELCRTLIGYYKKFGGGDSGVMRDSDGKTVGVYDHGFKRRRDQVIEDETLRSACIARISRRLVPQIQLAFAFRATRIERHIVACYDSETGGFFRAHRDNLGKATAHRRFAVTLNLNTGEYKGGDLRFPEFGMRTYTAEAGGAIVFSCSMLHEATPMLSGTRYAYLPFLYDDAAAKIREQTAQFIVSGEAPSSRLDEPAS